MSEPLTLAEKARTLLEKDLLTGRLKPGDRVSESRLAERYGIGRMPVREAIRQLQSLELLEQVPRYGTVVHRPVRGEIVSLYELLEAIEGQGAALSARRISEEDLASLHLLNERFDRWLDRLSLPKGEPIASESLSEYRTIDLSFHMLLARASGNHRILHLVDQLRLVTRILEARDRTYPLADLTLVRAEHRWIVRALENGEADSARHWSAKHVRGELRHLLRESDRRDHSLQHHRRFDMPEEVLRELSRPVHRSGW
jgi:DNA-binding GntR family transcriptional regulator